MFKCFIVAALLASIIFLIIDVIWLSFATKSFYRPLLGDLISDKPVLWAAGLFYVLYIFGLTFLILLPNLKDFQIFNAFWMGAIFGLVAYGTYDLTNLATIKGWSLKVTIIDLIWGGILTSTVSGLTIWIMSKINPI